MRFDRVVKIYGKALTKASDFGEIIKISEKENRNLILLILQIMPISALHCLWNYRQNYRNASGFFKHGTIFCSRPAA